MISNSQVRKKPGASVAKETRAIERRRKVLLDALMHDHSSPESLVAKDEILRSYPKLWHIVTETSPIKAERNDETGAVVPSAELSAPASSLTFASLFDPQKRVTTPKLSSLDVPAENLYNTSVWSTSPIKRKTAGKKHQNKVQAFSPKWKDYDVMSARWNYVRPYAYTLGDQKKLTIPSNAADKWVQLDTIPLPVFGNVADAMYLEKRVTTGRDFVNTSPL